jgi:MFS family permease
MQVLKQQILTREQKESIGLLQIGTFLEYFDLMLYVHMAVLLNELFFPETAPLTTRLIAALSFSSVFILRPFGALIFGYIGDNFGRKLTVIITTTLMAVSCIIMYILPTYNDIGITASYIMILCRAMQGMSSMGEVIGPRVGNVRKWQSDVFFLKEKRNLYWKISDNFFIFFFGFCYR